MPGLAVAAFSINVNFWMFYHFIEALGQLDPLGNEITWSRAFANAYDRYPQKSIAENA